MSSDFQWANSGGCIVKRDCSKWVLDASSDRQHPWSCTSSEDSAHAIHFPCRKTKKNILPFLLGCSSLQSYSPQIPDQQRFQTHLRGVSRKGPRDAGMWCVGTLAALRRQQFPSHTREGREREREKKKRDREREGRERERGRHRERASREREKVSFTERKRVWG